MKRRNLGWIVGSASLSVLAVISGSGAAAQQGEDHSLEIVDRAIDFHGGELFTSSLSDLQICSKSGCYGLTARIDSGRFEIEATGQVGEHDRRVRIDNDSVMFWQDGDAVEVDIERARVLRNWVMARAYFVYLPFRLNDDSVVKKDLGMEIWNHRPLHKVKVSFLPGSSSDADDEFLYWFDPETARLEQFAYSFSGDPGGLRFRQAFNYRRVGGILFFDQKNWGIEGEGLSVDDIGPDSVVDWSLVSTVTLQDIEVRHLEP